MKTFARLTFVLALSLQANAAGAQQSVAALQDLAAWQGEARSAADCKAVFRSFEKRNTMRPSVRRAALARCLEDVRPPTGPVARVDRQPNEAR